MVFENGINQPGNTFNNVAMLPSTNIHGTVEASIATQIFVSPHVVFVISALIKNCPKITKQKYDIVSPIPSADRTTILTMKYNKVIVKYTAIDTPGPADIYNNCV